MTGHFFWILILVPFVAAAANLLLRSSRLRTLLITVTVLLLAFTCLRLQALPYPLNIGTPSAYRPALLIADAAVLLVSLIVGLRHRHGLVVLCAVCQMALWGWLEFATPPTAADHANLLILLDPLSFALLRVVCLVGGLICLFAIPYMQFHEQHVAGAMKQGRFFAVLLLFLGAMNGLVMSADLLHLFFFFELTTLCSFFLISHDGTDEAVSSGLTALWVNSLGGLFLLLAIWGFYRQSASTDLIHLSRQASGALLPLVFVILAACTKSAQLPFQSWLLGAMIAPTPVSALLHSSAMVKVGAYLVLRFSPAFSATFLAKGLSLAGGFVFLAAALLAMGQQNVKRILAYSTISNLGLLFACAGLGTPQAMTAALLLIVFHAISKGMLFLCAGAAEQHLGSRDLEAMRGLYGAMPLTASFALIGIISLLMPPFGMVIGKWLTMQAGTNNVVFFLLVGMGSACTAFYWLRLGGTLLAVSQPCRSPEKKALLTMFPMAALAGSACLLTFFSPWLSVWAGDTQFMADSVPGVLSALVVWIFVTGCWALRASLTSKGGSSSSPYLSGANSSSPHAFCGPLRRITACRLGNSYLPAWFGEKRLTPWLNGVMALLLLALLYGGISS